MLYFDKKYLLLLKILYQDPHLVAINKPHGLLVHRTKIATDATEFALQLLRDQIQQKVFPIHRLDRKTAGVLLFGLNSEVVKIVQQAFIERHVQKRYLAIVRGYFPDEIKVDHPLTNDRGKTQEAVTFFKKITQTELDLPFGKYATSRYSLIEAFPQTGRMHQIRKHLNHLRHPIIGDRPHGCNKQNRLFLEKWQMKRMMLHAESLQLPHPLTDEKLIIKAEISSEFQRMQNELGLLIKC
ncbi:MAG: pseudouridine synthase [Saprospiraceae bacterium]